MKTYQKQKQVDKNLEKFTITEQEALSLKGGDGKELERGTVTAPATPPPPTVN